MWLGPPLSWVSPPRQSLEGGGGIVITRVGSTVHSMALWQANMSTNMFKRDFCINSLSVNKNSFRNTLKMCDFEKQYKTRAGQNDRGVFLFDYLSNVCASDERNEIKLVITVTLTWRQRTIIYHGRDAPSPLATARHTKPLLIFWTILLYFPVEYVA